ncbi:hypothetical protein [Ancylobacter defluvii]|nr:hypothetical protein [Ancylobacter defluvii]
MMSTLFDILITTLLVSLTIIVWLGLASLLFEVYRAVRKGIL